MCVASAQMLCHFTQRPRTCEGLVSMGDPRPCALGVLRMAVFACLIIFRARYAEIVKKGVCVWVAGRPGECGANPWESELEETLGAFWCLFAWAQTCSRARGLHSEPVEVGVGVSLHLADSSELFFCSSYSVLKKLVLCCQVSHIFRRSLKFGFSVSDLLIFKIGSKL